LSLVSPEVQQSDTVPTLPYYLRLKDRPIGDIFLSASKRGKIEMDDDIGAIFVWTMVGNMVGFRWIDMYM
jgi:hypothetical protein